MNWIGRFACAIFLYFGCSAGWYVALGQEPPKTLKDQLTGSWRLVSINNLRVDGTKYELFGPNAKGIVIFDRNGTYSFQIMRAARPSFVAESRLEGTTEENKAAVQGMISHFGSYEVDEPSHSITFRIEGSSYPNWDKTEQKQSFTLLGNQLSWSDPAAGPRAGDLQSDLIWRRLP
jgi:lipocalin-like protein